MEIEDYKILIKHYKTVYASLGIQIASNLDSNKEIIDLENQVDLVKNKLQWLNSMVNPTLDGGARSTLDGGIRSTLDGGVRSTLDAMKPTLDLKPTHQSNIQSYNQPTIQSNILQMKPSFTPSHSSTLQPKQLQNYSQSSYPWTKEIYHHLSTLFRLSQFRQNQESAINAALSGKDVFVLMPTGSFLLIKAVESLFAFKFLLFAIKVPPKASLL